MVEGEVGGAGVLEVGSVVCGVMSAWSLVDCTASVEIELLIVFLG